MADSILLTTAQLAEITGLPASYWKKARLNGTGPPYRRLGGRAIRYVRAEVMAWLDQCRFESTSQYPNKQVRGER